MVLPLPQVLVSSLYLESVVVNSNRTALQADISRSTSSFGMSTGLQWRSLLLPLLCRAVVLSDLDMPPPTHSNGHASTTSATSTVGPKLTGTP